MNPRDELKAFLDGELSPAQADAVRKALDQDPSLQLELDDMKRISASLKAMARPVETADSAIPSFSLPPSPRRRLVLHPVGWAAVAACALAALGALGGVILPQTPFGPARGTMAIDSADSAVLYDRATPEEIAEIQGSVNSAAAPEIPSVSSSHRAGANVPVEGSKLERVESVDHASEPMAENGSAQALRNPLPPGNNLRAGAIADGRIVDQRQIIKTGDMTVRVNDVDASAETVSLLATGLGGFVEQKNMMRSGSASASLILRIPAAQFDNARSQVASQGTVLSESQSGQDVTLEVADLGARMQTLKAELDAYNELLRRARTTGEIMTIQRQASQVRQEYEGIKAQVAAMKNMARMSTLAVTLVERASLDEPAPGDWFEEALRSAMNLAIGFGKLIVVGLIFLVILSPFWAPLAIFAWWRARRAPKG